MDGFQVPPVQRMLLGPFKAQGHRAERAQEFWQMLAAPGFGFGLGVPPGSQRPYLVAHLEGHIQKPGRRRLCHEVFVKRRTVQCICSTVASNRPSTFARPVCTYNEAMEDHSRQAVSAILQSHNLEVAAVGPRASIERALIKTVRLLFRAAYKATLLSGLGLVGLYALTPTGLPQEGAARIEQASSIQSAPVHNHWIQLGSSPFLEAGRRQDGSVSVDNMLKAWQKAGLPPWEVSSVWGHLEAMSPVVMGRVDPQLEGDLMADAANAARALQDKYPQVLARLQSGEDAPAIEDATVRKEWNSLWEHLLDTGPEAAFYMGGDLPAGWNEMPDAPSRLDMAGARAELEKTVQVTGVRSLRLPVAYWERPQTLYRAAMALQSANAELETITGWKGQVLGLNGRMELAIGEPAEDRRADGVTMGDNSGRLQVTTEWLPLAHEWFHAFDRTLGRDVLKASTGANLSESTQPLRVVADGQKPVFDAMRSARVQMFEVAPEWQLDREQMAEKTESLYWKEVSEGLAFAFGAYVQRQGGKILVDTPERFEATRILEPARIPTEEETKAQAPFFKALFAASAPMGLSDPAKAPSLSEWREHRKSVASDANLARRMPTLR